MILPLITDIYHYRPGIDNGSRHYSSKHKRFLPYPLLDDEPCKKVNCENRELEHILIYHRASADAAIKIAHTDMLPSMNPP